MLAARAIRDIGLDQVTLPAFMKALGSPEPEIRTAAVGGMNNFSTFLPNRPSLTLRKDAIPIVVPGLSSPEPVARQVAAFALGSLRADAAATVPELRTALALERNRNPELSPLIRLEILATLAAIGPAALPVLGADAPKFLDELKEIANETDDNTRRHQTCAALALGTIAPDKPQATATIAVLVKALRLRNFNKLPLNPVDEVLHERAKNALIKAGKLAAPRIAQTCYAEFWPETADTMQTSLEKAYARKKTCEVLENIGPQAKHIDVRALLERIVILPNQPSDVVGAAKSAYFTIYGKR